LILKKGHRGDHFVVVSYGLPHRGRPSWAASVKYKVHRRGPALSNAELTPSMREEPCYRLYKAPLVPETPKDDQVSWSQVLSKKERATAKILRSIKPSEYLAVSSHSSTKMRVRAALQSLKPDLLKVNSIYNDALAELRRGDRTFGTKALHSLRRRLWERGKFSIYDHLLHRYILWTIGELKRAKLVLSALGITCQDLRNPLLKNYGKDVRGSPKRPLLFVVDKEYLPTTSMTLPYRLSV